jgi:hypothetical protein
MSFATGWENPANRRATVYVAKQCGASPCVSSESPGACGQTPATACGTVHAGLYQLIFLQQRFPNTAGYDVLEIMGDSTPYHVNHELRWDAYGTGTQAHPRVIVGRTSAKGHRVRLVAGPHASIPLRNLSGIASGNLNAGLAFANSAYWVLQDLSIDCQNAPRDDAKRYGIKVTYVPHTSQPPRPNHLYFKNVEITRCGQEAYELRGAEDVTIEGGRLYNNQAELKDEVLGRYTRVDANGVAIQAGSTRIRVRGVLSYLNSGDSVQCQGRVSLQEPETNNPSHILIEDNTFFGNLENAVDIKSCHHVNVKGSNYFFGYRPSDDNGGSCHGSAIILHEGAAQVLVEGARIHDAGVGITVGNENFEVRDVILRRNLITRMNQAGRLGNLDGKWKYNCGDGITINRGVNIDVYHNTLHEAEHAGISVAANTHYTGTLAVRVWNNILSQVHGLSPFEDNVWPPTRNTSSWQYGGALRYSLANSTGLYSQANLFYLDSGPAQLAKVVGSSGSQLKLGDWQTQMPTNAEDQGNLDLPPKDSTPGSQEGNPQFVGEDFVPAAGSPATNSALVNSVSGGAGTHCGGAPDKGAFESDCGPSVCLRENAAPTVVTDLSDLSWGRQLQTCAHEELHAVAVGAGGDAIAAGFSRGAFASANLGGADAVLKRYSPAGASGWAVQLGSAQDDIATAVATSAAGDVYVAGWTRGALFGTPAGGQDAFLARYSSSGALQWVRQLGTAYDDVFNAVAVDASGNVYAVGTTRGDFQNASKHYGHPQALLAKYSASGTLLFTRQHGGETEHGSDDWGYGYTDLALDGAGNVFAAGWQTYNTTDGRGVYVRKFNPAGTTLASQEYAYTQAAVGDAIAIDSLGQPWVAFTYAIGYQVCDYPDTCATRPVTYSFIMRFHRDTLAPQLFDTSQAQGPIAYPATLGLFRPSAIRFDASDRLLAAGTGSEADILEGMQDFTVQRFTLNLTTQSYTQAVSREWAQWGGSNALCPGGDAAHGMALDASGNPVVAGSTCGPLFSETSNTPQHHGKTDALLMKFVPTP